MGEGKRTGGRRKLKVAKYSWKGGRRGEGGGEGGRRREGRKEEGRGRGEKKQRRDKEMEGRV